MGCSKTKHKADDDNGPVPWDAPKPKAKLRKQLTVSDENGWGDLGQGEPQSPLSQSKNSDIPSQQKPGLRRSFSCSSVTDAKGKANFAEKTMATTDGEANPQDFGIYVTCRKGTKPGSPPNQDSWYVKKDENFAVYGVFDGHGKYGHHVSNFVKRHLPTMIENDDRFRGPQQHTAVIQAFEKMTKMIDEAAYNQELDCNRSGSTATIAIHDPKQEMLITAHVGDSGAALSRGQQKSHYLTPDHKPNLPGEMKRIKSSGGHVDFDGYNYRVYKTGESYPGLNMSRAFGDLLGRTAGITSIPDINQVKLTPSDNYLMLCSDGVWEWLLPQEAFDICDKALSTGGNPAKELAFAASNAWVENAEDVIDDITCVFIDLKRNGRRNSLGDMPAKKSILKRSNTNTSLQSFNSHTASTASQKSAASHKSASDKSEHSQFERKIKAAEPDKHSLASSNTGSGSAPSKEDTENGSGLKEGSGHEEEVRRLTELNKKLTDLNMKLQEQNFPDLDAIPSSRSPDKPLKTPLLPFRSYYVAVADGPN